MRRHEEVALDNPERWLDDPEDLVENHESLVQNPESLVDNPERWLDDPEDLVENPEDLVENPESVVENPERSLDVLYSFFGIIEPPFVVTDSSFGLSISSYPVIEGTFQKTQPKTPPHSHEGDLRDDEGGCAEGE